MLILDHVATASGQSKKKAKHAAARVLLEKIIQESDLVLDGIDLTLDPEPCEPPAEIIEESDDLSETNPVGKLQEICMKRHWRPPRYETINEEGLPHERIFSMECFIENMRFCEIGIAKSKKLAKRKAAHQMLLRLQSENLTEADELTDIKKTKPLEDLLELNNTSIVNRIIVPAKDKIEKFYGDIKEDVKIEIDVNLQSVFDKGSSGAKIVNYMGVVEKTAKLVLCSPKYLIIPELSKNQLYQCLLHLLPEDVWYSDLPVLTSFGMAESIEEAKEEAARKALIIFSLLLELTLQNGLV